MAAVGIVGGLGVDATIHYYEKITASCKARSVVPDLIFTHADVERGQGFVRAGDLNGLAAYLGSFIERMAASAEPVPRSRAAAGAAKKKPSARKSTGSTRASRASRR